MKNKIELSEKSIAKTSWFYELMVWVISFASKFVFHAIRYYFPEETKKIIVSHPLVAFANHVDERDIPLLAAVHPVLEPKSRYSLPVRRDMLEKNFLIKEFKPRGLAKYIFHLVDASNILPNLGKYVGAIPVARPFRDDSKELLRAGKLRDIVNEQWEILLQGIRQGRKLFLFPEGTFTNDGSIGQIRKGIFFLQEKISDLNLFPLTLTYDYLSEKKPIVHVGYGKIFRLKPGMNEQEVAIELRRILNLTFTLTPANLFSFAILTEEFKSGIGRHFLFYKMKKMAEELERNQILYISRELLIKSYDELFADILANAKNTGFIELLENKKYRGTEKLFSSIDIQDTGGKRKIRKINPYLYHCNQLKSIQNDLNKIWKNIEVYD